MKSICEIKKDNEPKKLMTVEEAERATRPKLAGIPPDGIDSRVAIGLKAKIKPPMVASDDYLRGFIKATASVVSLIQLDGFLNLQDFRKIEVALQQEFNPSSRSDVLFEKETLDQSVEQCRARFNVSRPK